MRIIHNLDEMTEETLRRVAGRRISYVLFLL